MINDRNDDGGLSCDDDDGVSKMSFEVLFKYVYMKRLEKTYNVNFMLTLMDCKGLYDKYKLVIHFLNLGQTLILFVSYFQGLIMLKGDFTVLY